jgi:hypothetical protein
LRSTAYRYLNVPYFVEMNVSWLPSNEVKLSAYREVKLSAAVGVASQS